MPKTHASFVSLIAVCSMLLASGCASPPPPPTPDLTPAEFFQRARDASEKGEYKLALEYYTLFQKTYPDDRDNQAWASYEIAFLYHKMGDDAQAIALFNDLLSFYAKSESPLPDGPRILAEKVKAEIEAKLPKPS